MGYEFTKRKINRGEKYQNVHTDSSRNEALPNSLVMRIMRDPAAEKEADRLSRNVTSSAPDELMQEMGGRLGADFSDVQFHSDPLSMDRSRAMGARAWAQGRDVYFGKGGFDPKVAAHELVHTVQQGAVRGNTAQTAPYGAVQLFSGEDDNAIHRRVVPANATNLELMTEQKNSSRYGAEVFSDLKSSVKTLAQKSGSRIRNVTEDSGLSFLANLGERDYSGKEILRDIAERTVINKDEMYDREDEYEGFLDYMKNRTDKVGLEAASLQAGILNGQPKYNHNNDENTKKRAYEMTSAELANDTFNPTHDTEIAEVLNKIDNAHNTNEAYYAFLGYTENKEYSRQEINNGTQVVNFAQQPIPSIDQTEVDPAVAAQQKQTNDAIEAKITAANRKIKAAKDKGKKAASGSQERADARQEYEAAKKELDDAQAEKARDWKQINFRYKQGATVNVSLLKAKLKNMVRQIRDYPELKHKIGGLNIQWNQTLGAYRDDTNENVMAVSTSPGASEKATVHYDAYVDRDSPEGRQERNDINNKLANSIGNLNKVGNHELGHVLESTLNTSEEDQIKGVTSNDILQSVLPKVMSPQEQSQVRYNQQDGRNAYKKAVYQGQVDTTSPIFKTKGMSSSYGQSMPKEWFAEAFHDVYTKGADAKQTSIEIVKEYEKRQIARQKAGFKKKEAGWFTRFRRSISRWFNFGRRHGDPEPAPQNANVNQAPAGPVPVQNPLPVGPAVNQAAEPDPLQHYEDNLLAKSMPGADPFADPDLIRQDEENILDQSMIAERPGKKKKKKKR